MSVNDYIHTIAGAFIIVSLALGIWAHPYWFFFTAFVGANLFQYGITKVCPMGIILKKLGVQETVSCNGS
jgi:ABC-type transporter Mla maintaining outer membrane lipid asymmetry permease subunit MlaE